MEDYRHTQIGYVVIAMTGGTAIFLLVMSGAGRSVVPAAVAAVLISALVLFSTLTVQVRDGTLAFWFGPGLIRKTVSLGEVVGCTPVTNPWYYGWGVRMTPYGMLYNVNGRGAVEIVLKSGERLRIGTDQPEKLSETIRAAVRRAV